MQRAHSEKGKKIMSQHITESKNFPNAPFYVLANDKFLSGWGPAKGKVNTVVLPCATLAEAETVEKNAKNRSDMKFVRIVSNKPRMKQGVMYSLMCKDDAERWYTPGGF